MTVTPQHFHSVIFASSSATAAGPGAARVWTPCTSHLYLVTVAMIGRASDASESDSGFNRLGILQIVWFGRLLMLVDNDIQLEVAL